MLSKILCGKNACDLECNLNKFLKFLCHCGNYEVINIFATHAPGCCSEKIIVLYRQVCQCNCDFEFGDTNDNDGGCKRNCND